MSNYDFKALSDYDFEILVRDLLQNEISVRLENFTAGRDQGIDLRYSCGTDRSIIVQCKHYAESGYRKLLRHLSSEELPKVKRLNPQRYIVATSVGLTPSNKDALLEVLRPYCSMPGDILGREDLNNLLTKFPSVEKQNYKLWLTSTALMERILHSRMLGQSEAEVSRIRKTLLFYVQNDSFFEAQEILNQNSYCIIAGIPGIGKSTLAEILLMSYLDRGYEAVKISSDIREAYEVYDGNKKQAFYYDDFLGQTSLAAKLNKNEDQELLRFVERIQSSNNGKLILTTREYILNQAKASFERLARSTFDLKKCVIDLEDYTRFHRAKILYNHVFFSKLPLDFRSALVKNEEYLKIVGHRNFNPRIVSWMTDRVLQLGIAPDSYVDTFIANLDNPTQLWEHAFENQLSNAGRHLLLALVSLPPVVFLDDLEQAFVSLYTFQSGSFSHSASSRDFKHALKELEGTFIQIDKQSQDYLVRFQNPSIRDFLANYLSENLSDLKAIFLSAVYYEQAQTLWYERPETPQNNKSVTKNMSRLMAAIIQCQRELTESLTRNYKSQSCTINRIHDGSLDAIYWRREPNPALEDRAQFAITVHKRIPTKELSDVIRLILSQLMLDYKQGQGNKSNIVRTIRILESSNYHGVDRDDLVASAKGFLMGGLEQFFDFECINDFELSVGPVYTDMEPAQIVNTFYKLLPSEVDFILSNEKEADVIRALAETLGNIGEAYKVDVSSELEQLEEHANEAEQASDGAEDEEEYRFRSRPQSDEGDIRQLFEMLLDSHE